MTNENQIQQITDFKKVPEIKFYRISVAAKVISISKSQMWTLIRDGIISAYKISDKITLIKAVELLEYVENSKVEKHE